MTDKAMAIASKLYGQQLVDRAKLALEQALPKNVGYVVLLSSPDFGVYGASFDKYNALLALRGLVQALEKDCVAGGG